ncbi:MAG: flavin monoamine oxidase family protein, partial [Terriglobales bacterium]
TVHYSTAEAPIELGAEFVHGRPPEIFEIIKRANLPFHEVGGQRWCSRNGELGICPDLYEQFEQVFKRMPGSGEDRSFLDFLNRDVKDIPEDLRKLVLEYIEGFEAARPDCISVQALVRENKAADAIDGDRAFRLLSGYDALLTTMMADAGSACAVHLNTAARKVRWREGTVEVESEERTFHAPRALITLPLAVLQAGEVTFDPELAMKQNALNHLEMGVVVRVILRFRERFWENMQVDGKSLRDMSFLHSDNPYFPTWWTTMPRVTPMLTGWSAGPHGVSLAQRPDEEIMDCAMRSLAELLHLPGDELRDLTTASYFHNWQKDPFSRGAYSYACVGGLNAAQELAKPVGGRLFFAGEATDFNGRNGTVDGAISSGHRAAREILQSLQK